MLLAAGDIPDLLTVGMDIAGLATYVDQGVLAELPRSMIEEHMPGYMDTYLGGFDAADLWSFGELDGRNMGLPLLHPSGIARRAIAWNAQWLLNTGFTEIPVTLERVRGGVQGVSERRSGRKREQGHLSDDSAGRS